jgi:hypothetical protein
MAATGLSYSSYVPAASVDSGNRPLAPGGVSIFLYGGICVASGCLVLLDGWNHVVAARQCFGREVANSFPIDRLAWHVASLAGEQALSGVVVFMAIPEREPSSEIPEHYAWRKRHRKLQNAGVQRPKNVRFSYHDLRCPDCRQPLDRMVKCECGKETWLPGWRTEKGADVGLAALAVRGALQQDYSSIVIFSQDSDFRPLVDQLREIHLAQGRQYKLYSAFPDCGDPSHQHWGVPGTRQLSLDKATYMALAAQPLTHVGSAQPQASAGSPGR